MQIAKFYDKTALSKERKKGRSILFGLLLEATGVEESQYRRIGIAEIPEEEGFAERWEEMDVSLVWEAAILLLFFCVMFPHCHKSYEERRNEEDLM